MDSQDNVTRPPSADRVDEITTHILVIQRDVREIHEYIKKQSESKIWKLLLVIVPVVLTSAFTLITWLIQTHLQKSTEERQREMSEERDHATVRQAIMNRFAESLSGIEIAYDTVADHQDDLSTNVGPKLRVFELYLRAHPADLDWLSEREKRTVENLRDEISRWRAAVDVANGERGTSEEIIKLQNLHELVTKAYEAIVAAQHTARPKSD